jgi:hypothetical protein
MYSALCVIYRYLAKCCAIPHQHRRLKVIKKQGPARTKIATNRSIHGATYFSHVFVLPNGSCHRESNVFPGRRRPPHSSEAAGSRPTEVEWDP